MKSNIFLMDRKFRQILLHFGGDKTGSTAIQEALHASRQILLESGLVAYPPGQSHAELGSVFCEFPEKYVFNTQSGIVDSGFLYENNRRYIDKLNQWIKSVPKCETLVFSYEGFVDLDEKALHRFKAFCENLADIVSVILYVRPPLSYAVSAMSQRVKQGYPSWPANCPPISPYKIFLERILSVFGKENTCVRLFSPEALRDGDVTKDFMSILGLPADIMEKISVGGGRTNKSLSWPALLFGEILINFFLERHIAFSEGKFHEKFGQYFSSIPGDNIKLTDEQIREIFNASQPHSEYLQHQFGIIFDENINKYLRSSREVSPSQKELMQSIGKVLTDIIAHNHQNRPDFSEPEFLLIRAELNPLQMVENRQFLCFVLEFSLSVVVDKPGVCIHIFDEDDRLVFSANTSLLEQPLMQILNGTYCIRYNLITNLAQGQYTAGFSFVEHRVEGNRELARYDKLAKLYVTVPRLNSSMDYMKLSSEFVDCRRVNDKVIRLIENASGTLTTEAVLSDMIIEEVIDLPVRLENTSIQTWVSTWFNPINLSYHWLDQTGNIVVFEGERSPLPTREILPGQTLTTQMKVMAPDVPGLYRLMLLPVQEKHCWFDKRGFTPGMLELEVVASGAARYIPATDLRLLSQVGKREESSIISTGREGFLLFGPYLRLPAGQYVARLEGSCEFGAPGIWLDVVCDQAKRVLVRQDIIENSKPGLIAEQFFELAETVNDLEVRLWVTANALVRIEALRIEPNVSDIKATELPEIIEVSEISPASSTLQ